MLRRVDGAGLRRERDPRWGPPAHRGTAPVKAPLFEFYDTENLVVGDPEDDTGNPLALADRTGGAFTLAAPAPVVRLPLSPADPQNNDVRFFLKVTDECGRTVDLDPQFALSAADRPAAPPAAPLLAWEPPRIDRLGSLAEVTGGILSLS